MATMIPNAFRCPSSNPARRWSFFSDGSVPVAPLASSVRFSRIPIRHYRMVCTATSAAGSPHANSDENPYEVIGVSPIEGFDTMKAAYTRRRKDAERRGDEAYAAKLERAYDKIMMSQLQNRKKGLAFGSFKVSKDIKYADKQPIVPWGPRYSRSNVKDMRINMAISAVFTIWIFIKRSAEWKPLQFLAFIFFYRIFEKLKSFEPAVSPTFTEDGEDEGRALRMGKRLLRSLSLVFGCIAVSSLGYTGLLNLIEFLGHYIPVFLYNNQNAEERNYSIYIHSEPGIVFDESTTSSPFFYGRQLRGSVKVAWGESSMVDAERLLLAAALEDPANQRFILISDSCVPLYNFSYIYGYLMSSSKSFVDSFLDKKEKRYNPKMSPAIPKDKWRKGSQWITLVRKHAEVVIADNAIFPAFKRYCRRRSALDPGRKQNIGVHESIMHVFWYLCACCEWIWEHGFTMLVERHVPELYRRIRSLEI